MTGAHGRRRHRRPPPSPRLNSGMPAVAWPGTPSIRPASRPQARRTAITAHPGRSPRGVHLDRGDAGFVDVSYGAGIDPDGLGECRGLFVLAAIPLGCSKYSSGSWGLVGVAVQRLGAPGAGWALGDLDGLAIVDLFSDGTWPSAWRPGQFWGSARLWPPRPPSPTRYQRPRCAYAFPDRRPPTGHRSESWTTPRVARGLAVGDLDNDGRMEITLLPQEESAGLLAHSRTEGGHFVTFHLEGTRSNRDAVGAVVAVGRRRRAWRYGGGSYQSASASRVLLRPVRILAVWKSGVDHFRTQTDHAAARMRRPYPYCQPLAPMPQRTARPSDSQGKPSLAAAHPVRG